MIRVSNVSKRYGTELVVDDVSITLPASGITAIIGPNGAGKSTLLSMISRLLPMSGGAVTVDGLDVTTTPSDELARRLSILRQDNHIAARLTVRDLVAFGRYPYTKGRPTVEDRTYIDQAVDYLGLTALSDRFVDELSGGQRQRAFVAMVLCQDTDYVLLDEPLNHLDIKHAIAMMAMLRKAADELKKTMVLVLHDINFASCYADHIVAMKQGAVACQGAPGDIMQPDVLRGVYDVEIDVQTLNGRRIALYYR
jgi:iron complex transport system ATP-binding protein